jgi:hypothetical protein
LKGFAFPVVSRRNRRPRQRPPAGPNGLLRRPFSARTTGRGRFRLERRKTHRQPSRARLTRAGNRSLGFAGLDQPAGLRSPKAPWLDASTSAQQASFGHMRYYQSGLGLLAIGFVLQLISSFLARGCAAFTFAKYPRRGPRERSAKESGDRLHSRRRRADKLQKTPKARRATETSQPAQ